MKKMLLTGLATEQSFENRGQAQYYLIFNHGELRVPISEEAAQTVAVSMLTNGNGKAKKEEAPQPEEVEQEEEQSFEPAEEEAPVVQDFDGGSDESVDEDGVAQI